MTLPRLEFALNTSSFQIMKRITLFVALTMVGRAFVLAQPFIVEGDSPEGGGGQSQGGPFVVTGVIRAEAADSMAGGVFELSTASEHVEPFAPDSPQLDLIYEVTDGTLIFSWPRDSQNFVLQTSSNLSDTSSWTDVNVAPVDTGNALQVILRLQSQQQFYQLRKKAP